MTPKHFKICQQNLARFVLAFTIMGGAAALAVPAYVSSQNTSLVYDEDDLKNGSLNDFSVKTFSYQTENQELLMACGYYDAKTATIPLIPIAENLELLEKYRKQNHAVQLYRYIFTSKQSNCQILMGMTSDPSYPYNTDEVTYQARYRGIKIAKNGKVEFGPYCDTFEEVLESGYPFFHQIAGVDQDYQDAVYLKSVEKGHKK